jgi:serine/threonine protein kinase
VVRLYDVGVDGERIYLLLELVDGKNLRETLRLHGGRPPLETLVRWIRQAAEGVAEAHRHGIVHRDLKPENLLVTPQEVVKVIDFGVAKLTGWGVRTTHEQKMGTALYMSPEQIQGKPPNERMDVYAMGLILYEAVAGAHPIVTEPASAYQICALQLTHRPRPLIEAAPEIPPELGAVADRAIEKHPEARFPDMRAFTDALHGALGRLGEDRRAALRSLVTPPPAAPRSSRDGAAAPVIRSFTSATRAPARLTQTEPLESSLPFALTAPVNLADTDDAVTLPTIVRASLPLRVQATRADPMPTATIKMQAVPAVIAAPPPSSSPVAVAARPATVPSHRAALAVVIVALVIGVAGGAWLVLRVLPWPF